MTRARRSGLTLLEVLLSVTVVALLGVPLFQLFTTSKKMGVSGRDRLLAMSLASSYVSGLSELPLESLEEVERSEDGAIRGNLTLARLGVPPPPAGFRRTVSVLRLALGGPDPLHWQVTVTIEWKSSVSGELLAYSLARLL